jgi:hypothetical protein
LNGAVLGRQQDDREPTVEQGLCLSAAQPSQLVSEPNLELLLAGEQKLVLRRDPRAVLVVLQPDNAPRIAEIVKAVVGLKRTGENGNNRRHRP